MPKLLGLHAFERRKNYAQNAEFRFFQRQDPATITNRQDDQYGPDRWYVLTSGGAVNVGNARVAEQPSGTNSEFAWQLRQGDATPRQFGGASFLEGKDCRELRGRQVTFAIKARTDSTEITSLRMGIIEWTSTEDSVTSDVVSSWAATPTLAANLAFANTPSDLTISSTYSTIYVTATLGTSFNNIALFVWTPNSEAQNDDFYIKEVQLVEGARPIAWPLIAKSTSEDLQDCQRFYRKSYGIDIEPATNTSDGRIFHIGRVTNASTLEGQTLKFGIEMRVAPTVTWYPDDGSPAGSLSDHLGAEVAINAGESFSTGIRAAHTNGSGYTAGQGGYVEGHYTASAEL